MDLAGQYNIPAKKEIVWNALNNPNILKKSIKGCESLEKSSENEFNDTLDIPKGYYEVSSSDNIQYDVVNNVSPGVENHYIPHAVNGDIFKKMPI